MAASKISPEPPDVLSIESTLIRTLILKAWHLKHGCPQATSTAREATELRETLRAARDEGIIRDVLEEAVRYKVLREVFCQVVEDDFLDEVLETAKESGLLERVVANCRRFNVSLVQSAIRCGLLTDVLIEAVNCGVGAKILDGALQGCVLNEVLAEAKKWGMLSRFVEQWRKVNVFLVLTTIRCGLPEDVLKRGVENDDVDALLNGALTGGVLKEVLTEAREAGLLQLLVVTCRKFITSLVKEAILCCEDFSEAHIQDILLRQKEEVDETSDGDVFMDVLKIALRWRGVKDVLYAVEKIGVLSCIPNVDSKCAKLKQVLTEIGLQSCMPNVDSIFQRPFDPYLFNNASPYQYRQEVELVGHVLIEAGKVGPKVVDDILWGKRRYEKDTSFSFSFFFPFIPLTNYKLCKILSSAYLRGRLQKTLLQLQQSGIDWSEILQAAEVQGIYDEVLEADRFNELSEVVHAFITCLLVLCITTSGRSGRSSHCSSDHRKCVIDHVTIRSGDIERNPGPIFLNDWLKEMYSFLIRVVHGCQDKRIPWKKLGFSDPNNSKFKRSGLKSLFHGNMLLGAEARIPATHSDEFQLLKSYVESGLEPDLCHLEQLVETRKLRVTLQESLQKLQSLPQAVQQDVTEFLNGKQLQFTLVDNRHQALEDGETGEAVAEDDRVVEGAEEHRDELQQLVASGDNGQVENKMVADEHAGVQQEAPAVSEVFVQKSDCPVGDRRFPEKSDDTLGLEVSLPGISDRKTCVWEDEFQAELTGNTEDLLGFLVGILETEGLSESFGQQNMITSENTENTHDPLDTLLDQHISNTQEDNINTVDGDNDLIDVSHMTPEGDVHGPSQDGATPAPSQQLSGNTSQDLSQADTDVPDKAPIGDVHGPYQDVPKPAPSQHLQQLSGNTSQDLLQRRFDLLVSNLQLLTKLPNLDKRAYNTEEIEIYQGNNSVCRKRSHGIPLLQEDETPSKQAKLQ